MKEAYLFRPNTYLHNVKVRVAHYDSRNLCLIEIMDSACHMFGEKIIVFPQELSKTLHNVISDSGADLTPHINY
jgi:hypothetical protein